MASNSNEAEVDARLRSVEVQLNKLAERLLKAESLGLPSPPPSDTTEATAESSCWPLSSTGSQTYSFKGEGEGIPSRTNSTNTANTTNDTLDSTFSIPFSSNRSSTLSQTKVTVDYTALWNQYVSAVDPLLKIIHLTSVRCLFTATGTELAADAEALKSAIYYAAAASIQDEANVASSCPSVESLLDLFANDAQAWLAKSKFMATPTFTALQALAILLICGRRHLERAYIWSLTAILVRLAMKLRLHQDPDSQGVSFLECEYRRRLWWHICSLDAYTSELNNSDPLIYERPCTTRFPLAFQDDATDSSISAMSNETYKHTHSPDMFYIMIHFEITYYARTILYSDVFAEDNGFPVVSPEGKLSIIESLEKTLEEKYYRRCTCKSSTLCLLAITSSKMLVGTLKLKVLLLCLSKIASGTEHTMIACIRILEAVRPLRSDSLYSGWTWLGQDDLEWEVVIICLSCIVLTGSVRMRQNIINRAWLAIESFTSAWEGSSRTPERQLQWTQIEELQARALKVSPQPLSRRPQENKKRSNTLSSTPSCPNFARLNGIGRVSSLPDSPVTSESSASTSSTMDDAVASLRLPTDIKALGLML